MGKHRVIGGVVVTTPEGVFAHYRPAEHLVSPEVWAIVRPVAIDACRAADYKSVASALQCFSTVVYFLDWAHSQDIALNLEQVFVPSHVERYCVTALKHLSTETRSTRRGYLRRVGRACTKKAPWTPDPKPFANNHTILPPYSAEEVEGFWRAADAQATALRTRVAQTMLTLGLGAGLKPGEMPVVTAEHHVRAHPTDPRLVVVILEGRTVPVLTRYADRLRDLCQQFPVGPLIGQHRPEARNCQDLWMG